MATIQRESIAIALVGSFLMVALSLLPTTVQADEIGGEPIIIPVRKQTDTGPPNPTGEHLTEQSDAQRPHAQVEPSDGSAPVATTDDSIKKSDRTPVGSKAPEPSPS